MFSKISITTNTNKYKSTIQFPIPSHPIRTLLKGQTFPTLTAAASGIYCPLSKYTYAPIS